MLGMSTLKIVLMNNLLHHLSRLARVAMLHLVPAVVFLWACTDQGPEVPGVGRIAVQPVFSSQSAGVVELVRVRIVLARVDNGMVALDTVVEIPAGADSLSLALDVPVESGSDEFRMTMEFIDSQGNVAFTGGPVTVTPSAEGQTAPVPVELPVEYVGVGSNAVAVRIRFPDGDLVDEQASLVFGESEDLIGEALDDQDNVIPGTPVIWSSNNPTRADFPDVGSGTVVAGTERGPAEVVATLLTGQSDMVTIEIFPNPDALTVVSGNDQIAQVGTRLSDPVVVRVDAVDGPVPGVTVDFSVSDGTLSATSGVSDANGEVQTEWTLGQMLGMQTGTADVPAYNLQASFAAEAIAAPLPGEDVVVFNDMNMFQDAGMDFNGDTNNQLLVRNLVNFTVSGVRNSGNVVWWDIGRNSTCGAGLCGVSADVVMVTNIQNEGFTVTEISSTSGSLTDIPPEVKVIFLWNPTVAFTVDEINAFKQFASEGGRVVFVGEWEGFYGSTGIATENQFLLDMGAVMTNTGGIDLSGFNLVPSENLGEHQVTTGMTAVTVAAASIIVPGPQDFPLIWSNALDVNDAQQLIAGVARVDTTPILPAPGLEGVRQQQWEAAVRRIEADMAARGVISGDATGRPR